MPLPPPPPPQFTEAIRLAVVAASGLDDGQVVWADQKARAPEDTYITILLDGPFGFTGPAGVHERYDGTQPNGQEIITTVVRPATIVAKMQAFTLKTDGEDEDDAQAVMNRVQMGLQLPGISATLRTSGVSVFDFGNVLNLPRVYGADFEGRASLDVRGYIVQSAVEKVGYVATIPLAVTAGVDGDGVAVMLINGG